MTPNEFLQRLASCGVSHRMDPPLQNAELEAWRSAHPSIELPPDLIEFLRIANGLRIDLRGGEGGYFSLVPLREYRPLRQALYGEHVDEKASNAYLKEEWPDHRFAISRHADGTELVAIDTQTGDFLDADAYGAPRVISQAVPLLLDWLDEHWLKPLLGKAH